MAHPFRRDRGVAHRWRWVALWFVRRASIITEENIENLRYIAIQQENSIEIDNLIIVSIFFIDIFFLFVN